MIVSTVDWVSLHSGSHVGCFLAWTCARVLCTGTERQRDDIPQHLSRLGYVIACHSHFVVVKYITCLLALEPPRAEQEGPGARRTTPGQLTVHTPYIVGGGVSRWRVSGGTACRHVGTVSRCVLCVNNTIFHTGGRKMPTSAHSL